MREYFLDESGELGFSQNSCRHFLIAIIEAHDSKRLKNVLRKEKKKLHDLGWPREIEIKGTSLFGSHRNSLIPTAISANRHGHIEQIISRILSTGIVPSFIAVKKDRLTQNLKNAPYGIAYNYFTAKLFCQIIAGCTGDDLRLIVDQRNKETHAHMPFNGYLETRVIGDCSHSAAFQIRHEDSSLWLGLQAVDFISWGLFRYFEHNDDTFAKLIYPVCNVTDHFYTKGPA